MAEHSTIEWTDATWNPITGCSVVSPGCTNCYAMKLAGTRLQHHPSRAGLTINTKAGPVWNGQVRLNEEWLDQPLRWKRPRRIFVCAHGDLFAEGVPDAWIDRVFAVMALAPQHTFQVLTKRAGRMRAYTSDTATCDRIDAVMNEVAPDHWCAREIEDYGGWPIRNVWLGVSAEDQTRADERIPDLLATPAAVRFVSAEPLLGPIDFSTAPAWCYRKAEPRRRAGWLCPLTGDHQLSPVHADHRGARLDWIIVGGESGHGARPMNPTWVRTIRDQCAAAGVPFFFKQWGEAYPAPIVEIAATGEVWRAHPDGKRFWAMSEFKEPAPAPFRFVRVGKRAAGRLLDGVEHNGMPEVSGGR